MLREGTWPAPSLVINTSHWEESFHRGTDCMELSRIWLHASGLPAMDAHCGRLDCHGCPLQLALLSWTPTAANLTAVDAHCGQHDCHRRPL